MIRFFLLVSLVSVAVLSAQDKPAKPTPKVDRATKLLRAIDARIHYPVKAGLEDLQFDWKITAQGAVAEVFDNLYLRYTWKKPDRWITGLVDREGKPAEAPEVLRDQNGQALLKSLSRDLNVMVRQVVVGVPLESIYRDYDKVVTSREVNHKLEHRIIMAPRSKKRYVKVVMVIVDGLPREFRRTTAEGRTVIARLLFERRGERDFLTGMKLEENNRLRMQEEFHYAKQGGIEIVTGIDRYIDKEEARRQNIPVLTKIRFSRLRVNQKLPDEIFGPAPEKKKPAAPVKPKSGTSPGKR